MVPGFDRLWFYLPESILIETQLGIKDRSYGSISLNIHEVRPSLFKGEAYRPKKIPVDHFIGHIPCFIRSL